MLFAFVRDNFKTSQILLQVTFNIDYWQLSIGHNNMYALDMYLFNACFPVKQCNKNSS